MGSMSTQTITEFLEARIAEDESHAWSELGAEYFADGAWPEECAKRVLAECAAKRAILGLHEPRTSGPDVETCNACGDWWDGTPEPHPCPTIRALAAVYADHAEFQQEWKL